MSPRKGSIPPPWAPWNGHPPTETLLPWMRAPSLAVVEPPTLTASPSTTALSRTETLPPTAVTSPFTRPYTVMDPPRVTTLPSITLSAGITMS